MSCSAFVILIMIRDDLYINAQQDRWYRTGQEAESQMFAPSGE